MTSAARAGVAGDGRGVTDQQGEGRDVTPRPPRSWQIPLLFTTPPLTANMRPHWSYRAKITREIHDQVIWQTRQLKIPPLVFPTVCLHWQPAVNRRRDAENIAPTAKAALDAVVKAGVIADDSIEHVNHLMPKIHPPGKPARMWLEIVAADE